MLCHAHTTQGAPPPAYNVGAVQQQPRAYPQLPQQPLEYTQYGQPRQQAMKQPQPQPQYPAQQHNGFATVPGGKRFCNKCGQDVLQKRFCPNCGVPVN